MALQICLVDQIDPVLVTELIPPALVGIVGSSHRVDVVSLYKRDIPEHIFLRHRSAAVYGKFMAVYPLEYEAPAVDAHDSVLHLNGSEARLLHRDLLQSAVRRIELHGQLVEIRYLRAPHPRLRNPGLRRIAPLAPAASRFRRRAAPHHVSAAVPQNSSDAARLHAVHRDLCREFSVCISVHSFRAHEQIPHMAARHSVQIHIPEQSGEAPEILILQPARAAPLIYFRRDFIFPLPHQIRDAELRGGKTVLAVPGKFSVYPHIQRCLRSLKREIDIAALFRLLQRYIFHIASHRILTGHLRRAKLLPAVPGIHGVDVLSLSISLHLDMSRNLNLPELLTGDILPVEVRTPEPWIFRIRKFPRSVQAYPSASLRMCLLFLITAVPSVI